jgi:cytochrome c biogenesis protein CcmG, thiol:disulfide interchange protein DsbE
MERLYREVRTWPGGEDFEILAVSVDASAAAPDFLGRGVVSADLKAFADQLGLTFEIVHDAPGGIQRTYQTTGVPESFLVGRDGVIHLKYAGPTEWDTPHYMDQIRRLLER